MTWIIFQWLLRNRKIAPAQDIENAERNDAEETETDVKNTKTFAIIAILIIIGYIGLGILFYSLAEGWDPADAFYFTIVTLTTVGCV
jgi:hypothetical protein